MLKYYSLLPLPLATLQNLMVIPYCWRHQPTWVIVHDEINLILTYLALGLLEGAMQSIQAEM